MAANTSCKHSLLNLLQALLVGQKLESLQQQARHAHPPVHVCQRGREGGRAGVIEALAAAWQSEIQQSREGMALAAPTRQAMPAGYAIGGVRRYRPDSRWIPR